MHIEDRLRDLGLVLPEPLQAPVGLRFPFANVRVSGQRAYIAGHGPQNPDGSLAGLPWRYSATSSGNWAI